MSPSICVNPVPPISDARIRPPGSKSITNRALLCAALADGKSTLLNLLDSEDTRLMVDALRALGTVIDVDWPSSIANVTGCGGPFPVSRADVYTENSGTTMRFLTAAVSIGKGRFRLSGSPRMHHRPIGDLLDALRQLGVTARSESPGGCPPVVIETTGWHSSLVRISAEISSQFASGLMLAAPISAQPLTIYFRNRITSRPYLYLTLDVISDFGGQAEFSLETVQVSNDPIHRYRGRSYPIEPDATAASYFLGAAAISGGSISIDGLGRNSKQGDVKFADILAAMGCSVDWSDDSVTLRGPVDHGIDVDMNDISDTVQTLAVVALFAQSPTTIRGVGHIRFKESDRIADFCRELRKLGVQVEEISDGLRITPGPLRGATLETYNDHRMAMSLSLVGLKVPGVVIRDPQCVAKTYPDYFKDLERVVGSCISEIK